MKTLKESLGFSRAEYVNRIDLSSGSILFSPPPVFEWSSLSFFLISI